MTAAALSDIPLIPRKLLLGNPSRIQPKLSPDGQMLAWLAPAGGVMNIWAAPVDDISRATPVTQLGGRPIPWHGWTADGRWLLFMRDENGDENHSIYSADPATGQIRNLTPYSKVAAALTLSSRDLPGKILVGLNSRDPRWHDLWEIDLETGQRILLHENTERLAHIMCDRQGKPRLAWRSSPEKGGREIFRYLDGRFEPWRLVPFEDTLTTWPLSFNRAGTHFSMLSSVGRDTSALLRVDAQTGEEEVLAEIPGADIGDYLLNPQTFEAVAVAADPSRLVWKAIDPKAGETLERIKAHIPRDADFSVASYSMDDGRWIATAWSSLAARRLLPRGPRRRRDRGAVHRAPGPQALPAGGHASRADYLARWPNPALLPDLAGKRASAQARLSPADGPSRSRRAMVAGCLWL